MRRYFIGFAVALAMAACAGGPHRDCHRAARPDGVGPDGELHYPEVCAASTTPAAPAVEQAPVSSDPSTRALAGLRPETPDPCRQYAREHCAQGGHCEQVVSEINRVTQRKRAYAQCVAMLKRDEVSSNERRAR